MKRLTSPVKEFCALVKIFCARAGLFFALVGMLAITPVTLYSADHSLIELSDEERIYRESNPVIRVSNELDYPPFDFVQSGKPAGYNIDLLELLAKKIGISIEFVNGYTWSEMVDLFKQGEIDLLHALKVTDDRQKFGLFSAPYRRHKSHYVTLREADDIESIGQLAGKRFAVGKGWFQEEFLKRHYPEVQQVQFNNALEMLLAVSSGEVDVTAGSRDVLRYLMKKHNLNDLKIGNWAREMDKGEAYTHHFMAHRDAPELISMLNKALESLTVEELDRLERKWFGMTVPQPSAVTLTPEERAFIRNHPIITFGVDPSWEPFIMPDGDGGYTGYEVELLNRIMGLTGLNIVIKGGRWNKIVEQAKRREIDGLMASAPSEERAEHFLFSEPYNPLNFVVITAQGNPYQLRNPEDLKGIPLVVQKGNLIQIKLARKFTGEEPLLADNFDEMFNLVMRGEAKAGLSAEQIWFKIAKSNNRHILPVFALPERTDILYSIRKDWPELKSILDKAINAIPDQEKVNLKTKWFMIQPFPFTPESSIALTQKERIYLDRHQHIRVCSAQGWPPMDWIDEEGTHQGIAADYVRLMKEYIGREIVLKRTKSWKETMESLQKGDCDFVSSIVHSPDREKLLRFTEPFQTLDLVVATRTETIYVQDMEELAGKSIGVIDGSIFQTILKREYPSLKLTPVTSLREGLRDIQVGKIYGMVDNLTTLVYEIQNQGLVGIKISGQVGISVNLAMAVRKNDRELLQILSKALASISPQERQDLTNKWISVKVEQGFDYRVLWQVLAAATLIFLGIIYWNRKLAGLNRKVSQANEELAETQRIAGLGKWVYKVDNQDISWSQEVFRIAGLEDRHEAPTLAEYISLLHPDDRAVFQENFQKALNGQGYEVELRHSRPDGGYNYTLTRARPTLRDGRVMNIQGTVLDLTRLRKTEQALRSRESQLQLVMDNTPASIAYFDINSFIYLLVNKRFCEVFGLDREQIVGRHIKEIIGQQNFEFALPHIEQVKSGESVTYINTFDLVNGKRWINVNYVPDYDENGKVRAIVVMSYDITERMQVEEDLSKAKEDAEAANKAKSEFIANMSHEIRTPLNAVIGFSELLEKTEISSRQRSYLQSIRSGGNTLLSLINDILDLSKFDSGKMKIEREPVNIRRIIAEIDKMFHFPVKEKELQIRYQVEKEVPEYLLLDEIRLRQLLLNLIGNAVKFTHEGGISVHIQTTPVKQNPGSVELLLAVSDTGIGIPKNQHQRIFGSFEQQQGQSSREYGGTGLGLTISKRLVELMGGEIRLESEPGRGSTFTIHLHRVNQAKANRLTPESTDYSQVRFAPATVLIADDVESNRALVRSTLQDYQLQIIEAEDGEQAVTFAREMRPSLILMDIRLPKLDGITACRKIHAFPETNQTPIVMLTASQLIDEDKDLFQGILEKPFTPAALVAELQKHLAHEIEDLSSATSSASERIDLPKGILDSIVDNELRILWQLASESGVFSDAKNFAEKLRQRASEHQCEPLIIHSQAILDAVENFDVIRLGSLLKNMHISDNG